MFCGLLLYVNIKLIEGNGDAVFVKGGFDLLGKVEFQVPEVSGEAPDAQGEIERRGIELCQADKGCGVGQNRWVCGGGFHDK